MFRMRVIIDGILSLHAKPINDETTKSKVRFLLPSHHHPTHTPPTPTNAICVCPPYNINENECKAVFNIEQWRTKNHRNHSTSNNQPVIVASVITISSIVATAATSPQGTSSPQSTSSLEAGVIHRYVHIYIFVYYFYYPTPQLLTQIVFTVITKPESTNPTLFIPCGIYANNKWMGIIMRVWVPRHKLIDIVLNLIAPRVIEHLEETHCDGGKKIVGKRVQPGELSMLLWAYTVAKPKDCPPGWELPRRMERLSNEKRQKHLRMIWMM